MIRVLHIVHVLSRGGGLSNFIMNYYRNLDRSKIQFDFIYFKECESDFKDEIEALGGRYYKMPEPSFSSAFFRARREFFSTHRDEYSVIHCHALFAAAFFGKFAKKYGAKKIIIHSHSADYGSGLLRKVRNRLIVALGKKNSDVYAACSDKAARFMFGQRAIDNGKAFVINNSIPCEKYRFDETVRAELREELRIPKDAMVVCHIGGFVPLKNHSFLVDVFEKLHTQNPNSFLLLLGGDGTANGSTKEEIREKVNRLKLSDSVKFLGVRNDVCRILSAVDCLVMPSFIEGAGIALIEAQAAGVCCAASTNVPRSVNCTGRVQYLELDAGADAWAAVVMQIGNGYDRWVDGDKLADFDINKQTSKLMELYF